VRPPGQQSGPRREEGAASTETEVATAAASIEHPPGATREEWAASATRDAACNFEEDYYRKFKAIHARLAEFAPDDANDFYGRTAMEIFALQLRRARTELSRLIKATEAGTVEFAEWDRTAFQVRAALSCPAPWFEAAKAVEAEAKAEAIGWEVERRRTDEA
jgi:hypothetical protein